VDASTTSGVVALTMALETFPDESGKSAPTSTVSREPAATGYARVEVEPSGNETAIVTVASSPATFCTSR
jgi:hypothetical protein